MRPHSLQLFDRLYLGGVALGLVNLVLSLTLYSARVDAQLTEVGLENGRSLVVASAVFGTVIAVTLWYLIARLRLGFVRWILLALLAYGLFVQPAALADGVDVTDVIGLVASLLQIAGTLMLFRADAREWFAAPRS